MKIKKIPVAIVGLEPGTSGSVVQHFNHTNVEPNAPLEMFRRLVSKKMELEYSATLICRSTVECVGLLLLSVKWTQLS